MSCSLGPFLVRIGHKCMNKQPLKESPAETVFLLWSRQELTVKMKQFSLGGQRPRAKGREEGGHRKVSEHSVDRRQRGSVWVPLVIGACLKKMPEKA